MQHVETIARLETDNCYPDEDDTSLMTYTSTVHTVKRNTPYCYVISAGQAKHTCAVNIVDRGRRFVVRTAVIQGLLTSVDHLSTTTKQRLGCSLVP